MGVEMLELVVKLRKIVIFTTRRCYRSVCSHPFLVGMLCFLVFLYRSSPFVFSLLASASPVLVSTAVLLGTLLSFGQPNIPEIRKDEKTTREIVSFKTGVSGDAIVVEKNESHTVEKFTDERGDVVGQLNGVASSVTDRTSELHRRCSGDSSAPVIEERSRVMEFENRVISEEGVKIHDFGFEKKNEISDERLGDGDEAKTDDEDIEMESDKSPAESFDSEMVNVDTLDSPPGSPWKHVEEGEEQEEQGDDEGMDSRSDRAESSSPDASMADIIPMLDELHPLLDEDAPQPVLLSHDGSDAASERSLISSDSSIELDDNNEKHEDTEVAGDNEDADDEDEAQGYREGETKSAITWTEEDQKNLIDLGTSELERNQRLESLIARRRARKTMSMMPERNLIDLDSADLPFNVASISTTRNNPFDLPHDSYDSMALPSIPGSAPSILLLRRNPFDLLYVSSEEKPDLMGDSFQQEFTAFQQKEPFFRRHESFSVGPSFFGPSKQDRQEGRYRPYFVGERMVSDGASYSSFQRQSSGLSDSKASSIPETDSVASAGDIDDKNLTEENISHPAEPLSSVPEMEMRDSAGNLDDKNLFVEDRLHKSDLISMKEDKSPSEDHISQEEELISKIEHVSEHVGHGSQSSEETDSLELDEVEKRDVEDNEVENGLRYIDNHHEVQPVLFDEGSTCHPVGFNANENHSDAEAVIQRPKSSTSSSSLAEVSGWIFTEREAEGLSNLEERRDSIIEEASISKQPSQERLDLNMTNDTPQKEPVYDSNPPAVRKNLSASFIASDLHVESEMPPILIKRAGSFAERESESGIQDIEKNTSDDKDMSSSLFLPLDESQSESRMAIATSDNNIMKFDLSGADQVSNSTSASVVPESTFNHASTDSKLSQDIPTERDLVYQLGNHEYPADQNFSSTDADVHLVAHRIVPTTVEPMATTEDQKLSQSEEPHSLSIEQVLIANVPNSGCQSTAEHLVDKEVAFQPEQGQGSSSVSDTNVGDGVRIEPKEKQISAHEQSAFKEKPIAEYGEELVFLDKSVDETSSMDNLGEQEPAAIPEEIIEELSSRNNSNILGAQELEQEVSRNINSPTNPESISILSEAYVSRAVEGYSDVESNSVHEFGNDDLLQAVEESKYSAEATNSEVHMQNIDDDADEIKEFDELLLSELDAVGDFSTKELGSSSNEFEKHVASVEESSSVWHVTLPSTSGLDDDSTEMHLRASQFADVILCGEEVKCVSEPQTSGTSIIENTNLFSGSSLEEVQNYVEPKSTEEQIFQKEYQTDFVNSRLVQNSNIERVNPEMLVVDIEDIEALFKKSELTSAEMEIMLGSSEIPPQGRVNEVSSSEISVLEAQTLLDIDSAFKQINKEEIEKPNISESPSALLALDETIALGSKYYEQNERSSLTDLKAEFPILEARPLEDADLNLNQRNKGTSVRDTVPDSVDDRLHVGIRDREKTSSEFPFVETGTLDHLSLALKQVSENHQEKVLHSNLADRSTEFEQNEECTSRHVPLSTEDSGAEDVNDSGHEKLEAKFESPESFTTVDTKKQRGNSHKSSSIEL